MKKKIQKEENLRIKEFLEKMAEYQLSMIPEQNILQERYLLSDSFYRKMENLILIQEKKAKRRDFFKWTGTAAAVFLILFLIANPGYVAEAANRVILWFEDHVLFQFEEDTNINQVSRYQIGYIPEGYTLAEDVYYTNAGMIEYYDEEGKCINLMYGMIDGVMDVDNKEKDLLILEGNEGQKIYYLKGAEQDSSITWYSEDRTTVFNLSGNLTEEELLKIYYSITMVE